MRHRTYSTRVGVSVNSGFERTEGQPFELEDEHAALLESLAYGSDYDILQLDPVGDPDLIGLLVDGKLRATYRKVAIYTARSSVAQIILDKAAAGAARAQFLVRNFNRGMRGAVGGSAPEVPRSVEPEPAPWSEAKEFVTPPLSDGSPVRPIPVERDTRVLEEVGTGEVVDVAVSKPIEVPPQDVGTATDLFDMGRAAKILDDEALEHTVPAFLEGYIGNAKKHEVPETEEGWGDPSEPLR